ncbi:MAG: acyl carrier protein [Arenicella sp.]
MTEFLQKYIMKHTQEEIFNHTKHVMVELFELDEATLVPEANLYNDLDIDSIDAVDLMIELKRFVGKNITPQHFKEAKTLQDIVDIIGKL